MEDKTIFPELPDWWRMYVPLCRDLSPGGFQKDQCRNRLTDASCDAPNSLLLEASLVSFLPQLGVFLVRRDSSGTSPFYVLSNVLSATEQLAFIFLSAVIMPDDDYLIVHKPLTLGDRINLGHTAAVWVLWLILYVHTLISSPPLLPLLLLALVSKLTPVGRRPRLVLSLSFLPGHRVSRAAAAAICFVHLLVSVVPQFVAVLLLPDPGQAMYYNLDLAQILFWGHFLLVLPTTTVMRIVGVWLQARKVVSHPPGLPSPLSKASLGLQAVVFAVVAVSWLGRLPPRADDFFEGFLSLTLVYWFAINDGLLAAGQALLLWLVGGGRRTGSTIAATREETEPLLGRRSC